MFERRPRALLTGVVAAVGLLWTASPARAEVFLINGGGRLYGYVEREFKDEYKASWISVRTTFGRVDIPKKSLKRKLKSEKSSDTVYVNEARISSVEGTVQTSSDAGESWTTVPWSIEATRADATFPFVVRAGDRVRTQAKSHAEIDLGWGLLRLDVESEIELAKFEGATIRLRRGRVGGDLEAPTEQRRFRVETPQATMAVRGTVFVVAREEDRSRFSVLIGAVDVAERQLGAGQSLQVLADGSSAPGELTLDESLLRSTSDAFTYPRIDWVVIPAGKLRRMTSAQRGNVRLSTGWRARSPTDLEQMWPVRGEWHEVSLRPLLMSKTELTCDQASYLERWSKRHDLRIVEPTDSSGPIDLEAWAAAGWEEHVTDAWKGPTHPTSLSFRAASLLARWSGSRLPSESEWEYAARAGDRTPIGHEHLDHLNEIAWSIHNSGNEVREPFDDPLLETNIAGLRAGWSWTRAAVAAGSRPHPVGQLRVSRRGLYDIFGNLEEWTADDWSDPVVSPPADGGPVTGLGPTGHCARGGGFDRDVYWFPACVRAETTQGGYDTAGVRLVRDLTE